MKHNILLIGLGPHAQFVQYHFLEEMRRQGAPIRIRLLVELEDRQEAVDRFLCHRTLQPDALLALPVSDRNSPQIHPQLLAYLEKIKHTLDGVMICTEPKAHKKYILWALANNLDVITDKPLTAPLLNEQGPQQLYQDFLDIEQALSRSTARLCLLTNKRLHTAYQLVYGQLKQFVTQYTCPLTHIEISEGGGDWNFPSEFKTRENHPYKYGYGVLLHTGFHYVDLLLHYQSVNHLIGLAEDDIKAHACGTTPFDLLGQLPQTLYQKLFPKENFQAEFDSVPAEKYKTYGIADLLSSIQFLKDGRVITQASLNLLKNTLSARAWRPLPEDTYLHNGRRAQNYINIFGGPLFHIHLSYLQPDQLPEGKLPQYIVEIQRNTALIGGKSYERIEMQDMESLVTNEWGSLNSAAKFKVLYAWLHDTCPETDFVLHKRTVQLSGQLSEEIFARRKERFQS